MMWLTYLKTKLFRPAYLKSEREIRHWLDLYEVNNYTIKGFVVNVAGSVDLSSCNLAFIAVKFGQVDGNFDCSDNHLKSLMGAPALTHGSFVCHSNCLVSLIGSPRDVGGHFDASFNQIKNFEGSPHRVRKDFIIIDNCLESFREAPEYVGRRVYLKNNPKLNAPDILEFSDFNSLRERDVLSAVCSKGSCKRVNKI